MIRNYIPWKLVKSNLTLLRDAAAMTGKQLPNLSKALTRAANEWQRYVDAVDEDEAPKNIDAVD